MSAILASSPRLRVFVVGFVFKMSKSFLAARFGGFDLPNYQTSHLPNQPRNYFLVNTLTLPYPLPMHPRPSHFGVGLSQCSRGHDPSPPCLREIAACYCLINRIMSYFTVLSRENKVRNSARNYFLPSAFFFAVWSSIRHTSGAAKGMQGAFFGHGPSWARSIDGSKELPH